MSCFAELLQKVFLTSLTHFENYCGMYMFGIKQQLKWKDSYKCYSFSIKNWRIKSIFNFGLHIITRCRKQDYSNRIACICFEFLLVMLLVQWFTSVVEKCRWKAKILQYSLQRFHSDLYICLYETFIKKGGRKWNSMLCAHISPKRQNKILHYYNLPNWENFCYNIKHFPQLT